MIKPFRLFYDLALSVWLQAIGRGCYQFGSAILLFYMPIVFVNYGSLSATQVGFAIGGGSMAGFIGNFIGGGLADSPQFGRKGTLLIGIGFAIGATIVAIFTQDFTLLLLANIFYGLSSGLYWTAADAAVMDATTVEQRQSAFSVLSLMDSVGFGAGILVGKVLLPTLHPASLVFSVSAVLFFWLLVIVLFTPDTHHADLEHHSQAGWKQAFKDGRLTIYLLVNTLFISYIALVNISLPLYFINDAQISDGAIATLFTWAYIGLGAALQIPIIRLISTLSYLQSLTISMSIWGAGFLMIWRSGVTMLAIDQCLIFAIFAIAAVIYKPTSSAWIAEIAPRSRRGIYTAIAYQCWSIGYAIAPIVGGWALDQPQSTTQKFWLVVATSTLIGVVALQILQQVLKGNEKVKIEVP